ncbi:MAG TPA: hypothetical protein VGV35_13200 [Bryobacteraceae bacterium]|nr:hypothetical protein [Bryobacteraceae bacterium]
MSAVLFFSVSLLAGGSDPLNTGLVVHEWGTFTSIAGSDGNAADWLPLGGSSDLPCFVYHFREPAYKGGLRATVRMETPVLYFYSPQETNVSVKVDFPGGQITEWYPFAAQSFAAGRIEWPAVKVVPGVSDRLSPDDRSSHYYAARNTSANAIEVSNAGQAQQEKFLFYRGIANFQPALSVQLSGNQVILKDRTQERPIVVILFENRHGRIGYRVAIGPQSILERPNLTGDIGSLHDMLEKALIGGGLFPEEARAMLQTWNDSWFEEGTRIIYLLPRPVVDSILPLSIQPNPTKIERVFVGRIEIITPEIENEVAEAAHRYDRTTLAKYGRFLEPILRRLPQGDASVQNALAFAYSAQSQRSTKDACTASPSK